MADPKQVLLNLHRYAGLEKMRREDLARALFLKDPAVLPDEVLRVLRMKPDLALKASGRKDILQLVKVLNGEASTTTLGLPAESYHAVRRAFGMAVDCPLMIGVRPSVTMMREEVVPQAGGVQLDLSDLRGVEVDQYNQVVRVAYGTPWTEVRDEVARHGLRLPFDPALPIDYALGDVVCGEARLYGGGGTMAKWFRDADLVLSDGTQVHSGFSVTPNHASGYDLNALALAAGRYLGIPTYLRFATDVKVDRKNLAYTFEDPAKLGEAAVALSSKLVRPLRVRFYDAPAWKMVHTNTTLAGHVLEVTVGGKDKRLAAAEAKVDDAAKAKASKATDVSSVFDAPADAFREVSRRLQEYMAPGELFVPVTRLGEAWARVQQQKDLVRLPQVTFGGMATDRTASIVPLFLGERGKKDRVFHFALTKSLVDIARAVGGEVVNSGLALLLNPDEAFHRRLAWLRQVVDGIERAEIISRGELLVAA